MNLPVKTHVLHSHHFDSTIWNVLQFCDDGIIISTCAKPGTSWMQKIVAQLLFNGEEGLDVPEMSPWQDFRVPPRDIKLPMEEAQAHRGFLKTHLPVDALVFSEKAKYLYIGRDGRDVLWSLYNHHANANANANATATWYEMMNDTPGRVGLPIEPSTESIEDYF